MFSKKIIYFAFCFANLTHASWCGDPGRFSDLDPETANVQKTAQKKSTQKSPSSSAAEFSSVATTHQDDKKAPPLGSLPAGGLQQLFLNALMEDLTASFGESLQESLTQSQEADLQYNDIHGKRSKQPQEFKITENLPNKDQIVAMWKKLVALDKKSLEAHEKRCPAEGRLCLPMCPHSVSPEYQKWLKQSERVRGACGYIYCPQPTINKMVDFIGKDPALSVASGGGFLESLLEKKRVQQIIATDVRPPEVRFMPIWRASMVEAVNHWEKAKCLIISFPFPDFKSNASEVEDNQNKNITQIFKGNKLIYIGSDDPSLTGQQPDTTIWEQLTVDPKETQIHYLTKDVSQVMVRFFKRRESSVD